MWMADNTTKYSYCQPSCYKKGDRIWDIQDKK